MADHDRANTLRSLRITRAFLVLVVVAAVVLVAVNAAHTGTASEPWWAFVLAVLLGMGLVSVQRRIWQLTHTPPPSHE